MLAYLAPDSSVTTPCGGRPDDLADRRRRDGRRRLVPRPDRRPPRRQGREHRGAARPLRPPGRRGTIEVGDLFFRRPNVSVRAGATLTRRFGGNRAHNVTLANGPRGFSLPNLSSGRTYAKKLSVPGTYQIFCGLHPVDMTATVKVTRRRG